MFLFSFLDLKTVFDIQVLNAKPYAAFVGVVVGARWTNEYF